MYQVANKWHWHPITVLSLLLLSQLVLMLNTKQLRPINRLTHGMNRVNHGLEWESKVGKNHD